MKVSEAMTRNVRIASPSETIQQAARMMAEVDSGVIPVGENDHLVGMITDRDIAVRAVAAGKAPDTPIRDVMSCDDVCYCFDDNEISDVAANMADIQVRRLPVVNRDKRLVGILSLGDIAQADNQDRPAAKALGGISERGGRHSQSSDGSGLDDAVDMTFPASDPIAPGHATGTEPSRRPANRKAPAISKEDIERAARTKRRDT